MRKRRINITVPVVIVLFTCAFFTCNNFTWASGSINDVAIGAYDNYTDGARLLDPSSLKPGEIFWAKVMVSGGDLQGVDIFLKYDPTVLEAKDARAGVINEIVLFDPAGAGNINNNEGWVKCVAANGSGSNYTKASILNVEFKIKDNASGPGKIWWDGAVGGSTLVIDSAKNPVNLPPVYPLYVMAPRPSIATGSNFPAGTGAAVSGNIIATFTPAVKNSNKVPVELAHDGMVETVYGTLNGNILIAPYAGLAFNTVYSVTIPAGSVSSEVYNSLNESISWSITTARPPAVNTVYLEGLPSGSYGGVAVRVLDSLGDEVATTTSKADGSYDLTGISPGTYTFEFSAAGHLKKKVEGVTVQEGGIFEIGAITLLTGDANNDDMVGGLDFSDLLAAWNKISGQAGYSDSCDFNGDGRVGGLDFSLMLANWNKKGASRQ
ncbi:MAG: carboxypeptidase regulatory-like domain-containing protein [Firmicutes bacterium]|nr:carboxypeptidase regulatory-like domain-containing protein [Bacillota bacterium]